MGVCVTLKVPNIQRNKTTCEAKAVAHQILSLRSYEQLSEDVTSWVCQHGGQRWSRGFRQHDGMQLLVKTNERTTLEGDTRMRASTDTRAPPPSQKHCGMRTARPRYLQTEL
eukprot:5429232-Amphidinium_carterae.1